MRGRLDQVGAILAKGLDLAEAGVSLGVTIVSRVGSAAQQQFRERATEAAMSGAANPAAAAGPAGEARRWPPDLAGAPDAAAPQEPAFGITNRLPLMPGGTVKISFSVNNDSLTEPKKVEFRVDGFIGDVHGQRIDASTFAVKPASRTIGPADFEKFVLHGAVPAELPSDIYRGAIIVASGSELVIPVVLVVALL
jgi:hypothetical protein